jgi:hypothetical protein
MDRGVTEMLQITFDPLNSEKEKEKEHIDNLEQALTTIYDHIPDNMKALERSAEENIKIISHTIQVYRKEIEELK